MKIPEGWSVTLFKDVNYETEFGMYSYNLECLDYP